MSGVKYLLGTNIIIGMYQQNKEILRLLQLKKLVIGDCAYRSITRIELLSFPAITEVEKIAIESLLIRMTRLNISSEIEDETIAFRHLYKTKLPDSIIVATAIFHGLELLTLDKKLANKF
ncbi:MAG: PIN domain-containing protein [Methylococcaceae bacterium]|nr:PIN domain-containing protein [Methylococcaceae bacterium]